MLSEILISDDSTMKTREKNDLIMEIITDWRSDGGRQTGIHTAFPGLTQHEYSRASK